VKLADRERLLEEREEELAELEDEIGDRQDELDAREEKLGEREKELERIEEKVANPTYTSTGMAPQVAAALVGGVAAVGLLVSASAFTWSMLRGGALGLTPINLLIVSLVLFGASLVQALGARFGHERRKWRFALGASFVTLVVFPPAGIVSSVLLTLSANEFD